MKDSGLKEIANTILRKQITDPCVRYVGEQWMFDYPVDECPICLEPMDYCQGHGEIGDPEGFRMLMDYYDDEY